MTNSIKILKLGRLKGWRILLLEEDRKLFRVNDA
jgi:hypothetical protein